MNGEWNAALDYMYSGAAYDAMRALGYLTEEFYIDIKPQAGYRGRTIFGPAFTTQGRVVGPRDYAKHDQFRYEFYGPFFFKNHPIVVLEANDDRVAHSGDITSRIYKRLGAVGFVTDGNVRDIDYVDMIEFPTWCAGVNPIDAIDYWAITQYGNPIVIHNVPICNGDLIIASRDGVIRVPQGVLPQFKAELVKVLDREDAVRRKILSSEPVNFAKLAEEHGRW